MDDSIVAGKAFLDAVSRGGLTKPSQWLYITCMHAADLWKHIRSHEDLKSTLFTSVNSRALFIEAFVLLLEDGVETNKIMKVSCSKGHLFKHSVRTIATCMFNLFAKNITKEYNDEIHAQRKRIKAVAAKEGEKRDKCSMKKKKLNSS